MSRQPRGAARTRKRAEKKRGGGPTRKGRARAAAEPQEELLAPAQPTEDSEHEADGADAEEATSDGRDVVSDDAAPAGAPAEGGAADVIEAGSAVVEGVEGEEGGDASDTDERGEGAEEDEGGDASDADEQDDSESKSRAPAGAARRDAAAEDEDDDELVDGIPRDLLDAPDEDEPAIPGADSETRPGLEKARPGSVSEAHLKSILESLIFVSDKPVPAKRLARVARARTKDVERLLGELVEEYRGRGIELVEIAGGYQFRSAAANAPFVREIVQAKPVRLTRAQLETLAITAYRQPLTRPEIEEIRGVDSGSALKVLLERGLVKILGRKDEAGRPLLYGTTPQFLELFGLSSLDELPTLREFSELTEESRALFARKTGEEIGSIGDIVVPEGEIAAEGATDDEEEHEGEAEGDGGRGERAEAGEDDDEVDADAADGAEAHEHERETDEGVEAEESGSDDGAQASAERDDQDDEDESDEDEEDEDEEDEEDDEDDEEDDDEE